MNKIILQYIKPLIFGVVILGFGIFCNLYIGFYSLTNVYAESSVKEEEAFFVAKKAFADGFYEASFALLERFLSSYPDSSRAPEANLLLGECYFHQNKFLDALGKFEEMLNEPGAGNLKDAIYYWIAEVNFKGNNFSQAAVYYKKIISEFPRSSYAPIAYYSLGWCSFQEQKYRDALGYFKTSVDKFPGEPQSKDAAFKIVECLYNLKDYAALKDKATSFLPVLSNDSLHTFYLYFYLGEANYYLGNFGEAIEAYSKVLVNNPDQKMQALAKLDLAWSYLKLKRFKEAGDILLSLKQVDLDKKSKSVFLLGKAILMMETGRIGEARKIYEQLSVITKDPLILAQAYIGKADVLYNSGDYEAALKAYRQIISKVNLNDLSTDTVDKLYYNLGWSLLRQGSLKEAIKEFQNVVNKSSDIALKVNALCQIGDAYQEAADFNKAKEAYSSILRNYPDTPSGEYVQYKLGLVYLKESDYEAAILNLMDLERKFPKSKFLEESVYSLGLVYFEKQDYTSGQNILNRFRKEFKDSDLRPRALYLLGNCLYNLGDYASAKQVFKEIADSSEQNSELTQKAEYAIADCFYQMGDEEEALVRFKALRTKYPDSSFTSEVIWWLGKYYYQRNELELAARYFLSLIQDFPRSGLLADAYYALGMISAEGSNTQEALVDFNKAIALGKQDVKPKAVLAMADIYSKGDKLELALKLYMETLKDYPSFADLIYSKVAEILSKTGEYSKALEYYYKSLEKAPQKEKPAIHVKLAETQEARGKPDEALKEYLEAIKLFSRDDDHLTVKILLRIAQIYEDKARTSEALDTYNKVLTMNVPESKYAEERINSIKSGVK